MILVSAYDDRDIGSLISDANKYYWQTGVLSSSYLNNKNFTKNEISSNNLTTNKIATQLLDGGYILLYLKGVKFTGKSGTVWNNSMHWVSIIGYRNENNKEEIYVGTTGTGKCGWYPIDEFINNQRGYIATVVFVRHN